MAVSSGIAAASWCQRPWWRRASSIFPMRMTWSNGSTIASIGGTGAPSTSRLLYTSRKKWGEARCLSPGTEKAVVDELAHNNGFVQKRTERGRGVLGLELYADHLRPRGGRGGAHGRSES